MRWVVLALLVAAGCGRFNFDELVPGGGNGSGDGGTDGDGNGNVDGDILIDAPPACFLAQERLTNDGTLRSLDASIAGSPTGFAVVWNQELAGGGYELQMERFAGGVSRGRTTLYTNAVPLGGTSLIWANNVWVVVGTQHYTSGNDDDLAVLLVDDSDGLPTASHRVGRTNELDIGPAIAWSGSEYGLVWLDRNSLTLYYRRLGPTLTDLSTDIVVDTNSSGGAAIGWLASSAFVAMFSSTNTTPGPIGMQALTVDGAFVGAQSTLTGNSSSVTSLAIVSGAYITGYTASSGGWIGYRNISTDDVQIVTGGGPAPSVVWSGSELGTVYWRNSEIRLQRIDAAHTPITPAYSVAATTLALPPRIAFSDNHYAVAWVDAAEEVFFSELCAF